MRLPAFPTVEYERFENPPLRAMLGQVQYPPILRLQKGVEAVADFQDAIRELFPGFATEQQLQIAVAPGAPAEPAISRSAAFRFTNDAETWSVLLAPGALTLEAVAGGRYSSYAEFARLFETVWAAAVNVLRPGKVSRQGLRYVDHLEGDRSPKEWATWINPELLGGMAREVLGSDLGRAVCELTYPQVDGQVLFRHGTVATGPQNLKGYLLDFDSVHTDPIDPSDIGAVMRRFEESHDVLYRIFRWCVTARALEEFRHAPA
jgi:uncharacterized protein (TIGR04255 family)